jgi:hypothetical protein
VLRQTGIGVSNQSSLTLTQPNAAQTSALTSPGSDLSISAPGPGAGFPGKFVGQNTIDPTVGILTYQENSTGLLNRVALTNSGGVAILAQTGSNVLCDRVTGTPNTDAGLWADRSSYIQIDQGGANHTTVTGTNGDTKFGHPVTPVYQTYATIRTLVPAVTGQAGFSDAYGNRIEP